jgi:hypothetical protein
MENNKIATEHEQVEESYAEKLYTGMSEKENER